MPKYFDRLQTLQAFVDSLAIQESRLRGLLANDGATERAVVFDGKQGSLEALAWQLSQFASTDLGNGRTSLALLLLNVEGFKRCQVAHQFFLFLFLAAVRLFGNRDGNRVASFKVRLDPDTPFDSVLHLHLDRGHDALRRPPHSHLELIVRRLLLQRTLLYSVRVLFLDSLAQMRRFN